MENQRVIEIMERFVRNLPDYEELKKNAYLCCARKEYSTAGKFTYFRGNYCPQLSLVTASNFRRGRKTKDWPKNRNSAYEYFFNEEDELIYLHKWADECGIHMEEFIERINEIELSASFSYKINGETPRISDITLCEMGINGVQAFYSGILNDEREKIMLLDTEKYEYEDDALKKIFLKSYNRMINREYTWVHIL